MCVSVQCKCIREKGRERQIERAGEDDCLSCFVGVGKKARESKCACLSVRMSFVEGFQGVEEGVGGSGGGVEGGMGGGR